MGGIRLVIGVLLLSPPAFGGALAKTVGGLGAATGSSSRPAPPGNSSLGNQNSLSDGYYDDSSPGYPVGTVVSGDGRPTYPGRDVTLELRVSLMSVHDSDGSGAFEVGFLSGDFGLRVQGRSFWEGQETGGVLRMDLGSLTGEFRFVNAPMGNMWLEGGVGGVATIDDIHAYGAVVGLRAERKLFGDVALQGRARYYFLADGVRLAELGGGVRVGWIEFRYQLFDFNVGPPLHGPEVGVTVRF